MVQTTFPNKTITVKIECFDNLPEQNKYVAWVEGDEYKGIVIQGDSIDDCLDELATSLRVIELYRKNTKK